jgi:hypothetical protein
VIRTRKDPGRSAILSRLYPFGETNCWQWRAASFYTLAFRVPFLHFLSAPNRQGTTRALDFAQYAEGTSGFGRGDQGHRDTGAQQGGPHRAHRAGTSTEQPPTAHHNNIVQYTLLAFVDESQAPFPTSSWNPVNLLLQEECVKLCLRVCDSLLAQSGSCPIGYNCQLN